MVRYRRQRRYTMMKKKLLSLVSHLSLIGLIKQLSNNVPFPMVLWVFFLFFFQPCWKTWASYYFSQSVSQSVTRAKIKKESTTMYEIQLNTKVSYPNLFYQIVIERWRKKERKREGGRKFTKSRRNKLKTLNHFDSIVIYQFNDFNDDAQYKFQLFVTWQSLVHHHGLKTWIVTKILFMFSTYMLVWIHSHLFISIIHIEACFILSHRHTHTRYTRSLLYLYKLESRILNGKESEDTQHSHVSQICVAHIHTQKAAKPAS